MSGRRLDAGRGLIAADDAEELLSPASLLRMRRFAATLVPPGEIDDLVQDAAARAWEKRDLYDSHKGSQLAWLLAIVADRARQRRRRWRAQLATVELCDVSEPRHATERDVDVRGAVNSLPTRQRAAVVLFYYVGLPVADVAAVLGSSVGAIKSNLHDARTALAKRLGVKYEDD